MMDLDDDYLTNENDSESDNEEMIAVDMIEPEPSVSTLRRDRDTEDFPFEVLTTEQIVQHMVDCIREVNQIVEVWLPNSRLGRYLVQ